MEHKNYGLDLRPIAPEDFLGGSTNSLQRKFGDEVLVADGDWTPYLPSTENQDTSNGDTYACVSFAISNAIEMLARRRFGNRLNLSDRFIAKKSGTVPGRGNDPKVVADYMRPKLLKPLYWSVDEKEWPDTETVEEFYQEPPRSLDTIATARGAEFEYGYQWELNVPSNLRERLKRSPINLAVTAWEERDGVYVRVPGIAENHFTTLIKVLDNGLYKVFDSFPPYIKVVHPDACQSVAMSHHLNRHVVQESWFKKFIKGVLAFLAVAAEEPVKQPETPQDAPKPADPTPPTPPTKTVALSAFCEAIKAHEGWFPGSRSFRNNNPGNARYSNVGYLPKYEPVLRDPQGFAIFKDYETGWLYLQNLVREKIKAHPEQTLLDFFRVYAPAEDHNDPNAYAAAVGKRLGVDYKTFVIKHIV